MRRTFYLKYMEKEIFVFINYIVAKYLKFFISFDLHKDSCEYFYSQKEIEVPQAGEAVCPSG